jgi:hypothetical protein
LEELLVASSAGVVVLGEEIEEGVEVVAVWC